MGLFTGVAVPSEAGPWAAPWVWVLPAGWGRAAPLQTVMSLSRLLSVHLILPTLPATKESPLKTRGGAEVSERLRGFGGWWGEWSVCVWLGGGGGVL